MFEQTKLQDGTSQLRQKIKEATTERAGSDEHGRQDGARLRV